MTTQKKTGSKKKAVATKATKQQHSRVTDESKVSKTKTKYEGTRVHADIYDLVNATRNTVSKIIKAGPQDWTRKEIIGSLRWLRNRDYLKIA